MRPDSLPRPRIWRYINLLLTYWLIVRQTSFLSSCTSCLEQFTCRTQNWLWLTVCFQKTMFTKRWTTVQSAVLWSHVVHPSVRLSVTLMDCDGIGWNSLKIISRSVSLRCLLSADPQHHGSTPWVTPWNFGWNRGGLRKQWISAYKICNISETQQDRTKVTFATIDY